MRSRAGLLAVMVSMAIGWSAAPAAAQHSSGPYARLSAGAAWLDPPAADGFELDHVSRPVVALGYSLGRGHAVELSVGRLSASTTEEWGGPDMSEAPLTVTVRAVSVGLSYGYSLPWSTRRVRPLAALGAEWSRIRDTTASDIPPTSTRSSAFGAGVSVGVAVRVIGPGSVVVSGGHTSYRHGERFARAIDLSGPRVLAGVQWQW